MALLETLRKLCSSLYLGHPRGTEAFGKNYQEEQNPPHAHPSFVRKQGQHPVRVQWHPSVSSRVRNGLK